MNFFSDSDIRSKLEALDRSQAIIEFALDGTILTANPNFLAAVGYGLEEIRGKHHGLLVEPAKRDGAEYRAFWAALARGEHQSGEFRRLGKGGREVWLRATYNPVLGRGGKPVKVVKFATDVTAAGDAQHRSRGADQRPESLAGGDRVPSRRHDPHRQPELPRRRRLPARGDPGPASQPVRRPRGQGRRRLQGLLGHARPGRVPVRRVQARRQGRARSLDPGLLQPDLRPRRPASEGCQVRHRRHRPGAGAPPPRRAANRRITST